MQPLPTRFPLRRWITLVAIPALSGCHAATPPTPASAAPSSVPATPVPVTSVPAPAPEPNALVAPPGPASPGPTPPLAPQPVQPAPASPGTLTPEPARPTFTRADTDYASRLIDATRNLELCPRTCSNLSDVATMRSVIEQTQSMMLNASPPPRFVEVDASFHSCLEEFQTGCRLAKLALETSDKEAWGNATAHFSNGRDLLHHTAIEMKTIGEEMIASGRH